MNFIAGCDIGVFDIVIVVTVPQETASLPSMK